MKILPQSNRKIFLLQPFYKTYIHKPVFNPPLTGHWAGGAQHKPRQRGGSQGTRRLPGAEGAEGTRGCPCAGSPQRKWVETGMLVKQKPTPAPRWSTGNPAKVSTNSSSNNPIWISDIYYKLDLINLSAQSWQWSVFGFLCILQKDEFENSFFIYTKVVLNQRKTSSLLKRRCIPKQTTIFNNCPAN